MKNLLLLLWFISLFFFSSGQEKSEENSWKIDSVSIKKNWRTRDKIIMRELQFSAGETVDQNCLDNSINQIWNIGNFATVDYSLDSISPESYLLNINAKDAFTFLPNLSFNGSKKDYNLTLGISDNNFLGRNISLDLSGNIGTYNRFYNIEIQIPRQLLYKNMTLSVRALNGSGSNYRYTGNTKSTVVAYQKKEFSGTIGNPFHTDYHYTFSSNLSWNLFQHKTDTTLVNTDVLFPEKYTINYLALSLGESVGLINRKRNQRDGYTVSAGYGIGIGLSPGSPYYQSFGLGAVFYKLVNPVIEFSAGFSTGYTTATFPSLIHYLGSETIMGLVSGEESGQGYYSGNITGSFTYINRDWFALEHAVFINFGKADDVYFRLYQSVPRVSLGTGFKIWTPMVPWLSASVFFSWLKGSNNWFHLNI